MFDIYDKCVEEGKKHVFRTQEALEARLSELQREMKAAGIPTIIVFEGWSASGKGSRISRLIYHLDPRGFKVFTMVKPDDEEKRYPVMHRYWQRLPAKGNITIFDRSWYRCFDFVEGKKNKDTEDRKFHNILDFESQLTSEGYLLIKIFLHISADEQKKRFNKLKSVKSTSWRIKKSDLRQNENYVKVYRLLCEVLDKTNTPNAPWHAVNTATGDEATAQVFSIVIEAMEHALEQKSRGLALDPGSATVSAPVRPQVSLSLKDIDLASAVSDKSYKKRLKALQEQLFMLQNELYRRKIPLVIVYEGWDAAGKGGNIKRVAQALDPRGYEVIPISAPNEEERSHHFLWRFWRVLPKTGHTTIFDRSWYGRVMVEPIEGFINDEQRLKAYDEINRFEYSLTQFGTIVIKFWLHIDSDEQLVRFTARQNTPSKQWKITDEDWRNRSKWSQYEAAVDEMIAKTNTPDAPWIIIESNDKKYARLRTLEELIAIIEKRLSQKDNVPEDYRQ
ncbi:MAG: polyphosphate:AMP phosphotransferase [Clostridia bacterium]|nr:polyphosphate:AMP phosphotransferase [Clostridia bacterium]